MVLIIEQWGGRIISKSGKTWDDLGRIGVLYNIESLHARLYMALHLARSPWWFGAIVAVDCHLEGSMTM